MQHYYNNSLFYMLFCYWRFMTTVVLQRHDWVCTMSGFISLALFRVLVVFPAALLHTVRLVRRLQCQFTTSWWDPCKLEWHPAESRTHDLPAPKWTHLLLDHGLVLRHSFFWYGGLLLALYNYNGLVAPRLSLYNFWFCFTRFVFLVCSLQLFLTSCAW